MKTAVFLGGGASAAEGAPMQSELIRAYFKIVQVNEQIKNSAMNRELESYFKELFQIDFSERAIENIVFPTFEEAMGILDLAVRRREALKHYDLENIKHNSNRIGFIRQYLVLLMAMVLDNAEKEIKGLHRLLIENLIADGLLAECVFITTNYDLLFDKAVKSVTGVYPDYGFDYLGCAAADSNEEFITLYKVHGSLNWLYCPACNLISLTGEKTGAVELLTDINKADCELCGSIMSPVIIPPTFFKEMSNVYLGMVWNKAEQLLRKVDRIIFCGYSFPDSDIHIKYLIKRVQTNRHSNRPLKVCVVNYHPGKSSLKIQQEKNRYLRFLGEEVNYTGVSFSDFACNPREIYSL